MFGCVVLHFCCAGFDLWGGSLGILVVFGCFGVFLGFREDVWF